VYVMIVSFSEYQRISDKIVPEFQNAYFTLRFLKKAIKLGRYLDNMRLIAQIFSKNHLVMLSLLREKMPVVDQT
jgi:hypothetical protein